MLQFFRQYRSIIWVIGIFSIAGLVFTMFDGGSTLNQGGAVAPSSTVAHVDDRKISTQELLQVLSRRKQQLEQNMQQYLGGEAGQNRQMLMGLIRQQLQPQQILDQLINQRLFESTARRYGNYASDKAVVALLEEIPAFQKDGNFDPLTYRQLLKANNLQPAQFEKELRNQAAVNSFRSNFMQGLSTMSELQKEELARINQSYIFESLAVDLTNFPEPKSVDQKEIEAFLADPKNETVLKAAYNSRISDYKTEPEVHAQHILIKEDGGGLEKIKQVREEIVSQKISFDEAAKKYSADSSNASKGGDLGFFKKGVMDPAFEKASFDLQEEGQVSDPVKSSFGYHLIKLIAKKEGSQTPFEEVKAELAKTVALEEAKKAAAETWLSNIVESKKAPSSFELKKYGLEWKSEREWRATDESLGSLGNVDQHLAALLSVKNNGEIFPEILPQGKKKILLRLKEFKEPEAKLADSSDKAQEALNYFFEHTKKTLEDENRIRVSEEALSQANELVQRDFENL